ILNDEERKLQTNYTDADEVKKICIAFIVELQNYIRAKYPEKELTTVPALELVNIVMTKNYFFEVFDIVRNFVISLAESFSSNTANSTILKVIQYVKNNYKEDLKLELLGELFNCNSAYLGKKFKEHTGVPFNTYLDVIRIEAAKEMLKNTDLKIYQISKLVGYSNTDYFFLKFKKHTNITPKKYKTGKDD
ncbi:MAG TPA: helix-turn-helix domain-containing protein, partial [Treponemataceae bacterium]|nr:helix-turn-helix domain-containing protein [Treponemataceae bacterium]